MWLHSRLGPPSAFSPASRFLGRPRFTGSTIPVLVAGGLTFRDLDTSSGGASTCGVTTNDRAYCWGWNFLIEGAEEFVGAPLLVPGQR